MKMLKYIDIEVLSNHILTYVKLFTPCNDLGKYLCI